MSLLTFSEKRTSNMVTKTSWRIFATELCCNTAMIAGNICMRQLKAIA
nr:MAG TPA: hypothetical protein [Caudoviricetes sp.]DAP23132.1 MAG TPA: hypothetical protein [Caudoviricetes sp.]DAW17805.1 MAG TPA: hypothetical protein [Caudoviricetes sp.]